MDERITKEIVFEKNITTYSKCFKLSETNQNQKQRYDCLVGTCVGSFANMSVAIRHLKNSHAKISKSIDCLKKKIQTDASIPIRTETNPTKIWNAIIQMIIFGALPFAIVYSQGFRYLIKPYAEAFKRAGVFFSVNELNVQSEIDDRATQIKKQISNETKGKMICLLIDIASRFNRSILGMNIAYWANGRINHRTIGMHTLKVSQTGQNLFDIVKDKLKEFGININQVFAVTTDNGSNLLKMSKLIKKELSHSDENSLIENDSDTESDDEFGSDEQYNYDSQDGIPSDENFYDSDIFNADYFNDLLANLRSKFTCPYTSLFTGISCAAHGLHLVVNDAIKTCPGISKTIDRCRDLANKLRTPKLRAELKKQRFKMALLDVKTRWSSLFYMVSGVEITILFDLLIIFCSLIYSAAKIE